MRLITPRLLLRDLSPEDRDPLARMLADPVVMRYFPAVMTRAESDAFADRMEAHCAEHGFGPMAVERDGEFIGVVGLIRTSFAPWVEVAWRIAAAQHNQGYATEAARAVLEDGFERHGFEEIVAYTVPHNLASRRVMEKLGMAFDHEFDHPRLEAGHPLQRHVLYRLRRSGLITPRV